MVAYSFKPRFVPLIAAGKKTQTIRGPRWRHARPGERIQLYTGMRTKSCRKIIPDPVCLGITNLHLEIGPSQIEGCHVRRQHHDRPWLYENWQEVDDAFAVRDGFEDVGDFHRFWLKTYGATLFLGVLIEWEGPVLRPDE